MKICPNCKVEYDDLESFCVQCGKKLEKEDTLDSLSERLKSMEESLSKLAGSRPSEGGEAPKPGLEKRLQDIRLSLLEKINHNADVVERLSERVKEIDGISGKDREKARETVQRMIQEESKNIGPGFASDLRKEFQDIKGEFDVLSGELEEQKAELESLRNEMDSIETRVAKRIYKELTRSLVK